MRVSDYIFDFLYKKGIKDVFLLSGGGNIHLVDAVGKSKLNYICNNHEQACATAAEGYARTTGNIGICLVTTGPGATNAITGVLGAWLDSIPMLILSGQVRTELIGSGTKLGVRQLGPQEINVIDMIKPITKYAITIKDANKIKYHLEKALYVAKNGRQGPVWLDIPLDIQGAGIDIKKLKAFNPKEIKNPYQSDKKKLNELVTKVLNKLSLSERPVLYIGNGVRLAGAEKELLKLIKRLKIPVLLSYVGYDLIPNSHPFYYGRAHAFGQRAANFIIQNSDFLLSIGSRMDVLTTGFNFKAYAREAYKIMVDIDKYEIEKPTLNIDLKINFDAKEFILEMIKQLKKKPFNKDISKWLFYGRKLNNKYPTILAKFWKEKKYVNPYCFIDKISDLLKEDELIVLSDGVGPLNCMYQAFRVKKGQRIILNLGCAQMGYGLPAAIGASFATNKKKRVICFEGDGSLQLNIHELQVMKHHNLPIKLFIYSNDGYQSIRNTQKNLFGGKYVGSNNKSGVSTPDFVKVGNAYGIKSIRINNHKDMAKKIKAVLKYKGPIICDINTKRDQMLTPRLMTQKTKEGSFISPTLENMWPFLSKKELKENMLIPVWKG